MLRILVDGAVERLLGHPPKRDDDGDIPLVRGEQVTYVRVLEDDEYVEVFSRVVHSVENLENAAVILAQLNRQWPTIKLILVEQSVLGVVRVDGAPFVAEHLLRALRSFAELAEASDELAEELAGNPFALPETPPSTTGWPPSTKIPVPNTSHTSATNFLRLSWRSSNSTQTERASSAPKRLP